VADAPDDFIATQLRAIVGVEIPIASLEGKWKSARTNQAGPGRHPGLGLQKDAARKCIV
jgi:transcriptional regulator